MRALFAAALLLLSSSLCVLAKDGKHGHDDAVSASVSSVSAGVAAQSTGEAHHSHHHHDNSTEHSHHHHDDSRSIREHTRPHHDDDNSFCLQPAQVVDIINKFKAVYTSGGDVDIINSVLDPSFHYYLNSGGVPTNTSDNGLQLVFDSRDALAKSFPPQGSGCNNFVSIDSLLVTHDCRYITFLSDSHLNVTGCNPTELAPPGTLYDANGIDILEVNCDGKIINDYNVFDPSPGFFGAQAFGAGGACSACPAPASNSTRRAALRG